MATKLSTLLGSSFTGTAGPAGTIEIGTVTTGAAGAPAVVTNSGTERSAILNFTLPTGDGAAITAVNDTDTTALYPVMVGSTGSNTTPKVTTSQLSFNASTGTLNASNLVTSSVSIGRIDGTASTPYIDFNSGSTAVDYDARIQVSGGNGILGNGILNISVSSLQWNNETVITESNTRTLTNKTLTNPSISGSITFSNGSTQSVAGATTGKAIAMAIVFGG